MEIYTYTRCTSGGHGEACCFSFTLSHPTVSSSHFHPFRVPVICSSCIVISCSLWKSTIQLSTTPMCTPTGRWVPLVRLVLWMRQHSTWQSYQSIMESTTIRTTILSTSLLHMPKWQRTALWKTSSISTKRSLYSQYSMVMVVVSFIEIFKYILSFITNTHVGFGIWSFPSLVCVNVNLLWFIFRHLQ